jgi:hypothetical protein
MVRHKRQDLGPTRSPRMRHGSASYARTNPQSSAWPRVRTTARRPPLMSLGHGDA